MVAVARGIQDFVNSTLQYDSRSVRELNDWFNRIYGFDMTSDESRAFYRERYGWDPGGYQAQFRPTTLDTLELGSGVCQHFAQVELSLLLRSLGRISDIELKVIKFATFDSDTAERFRINHSIVAIERENVLGLFDSTSTRYLVGTDKNQVVRDWFGEDQYTKFHLCFGVRTDSTGNRSFFFDGDEDYRHTDEINPFDFEYNLND
jgi:hypothetical protein